MRYNEFKKNTLNENVQNLFEVNMSPSALKAFMNSDIGGEIVAGFEAELIFPYEDFTEDPYKDLYYEDFEQAVDFFAQHSSLSRDRIEYEVEEVIDGMIRELEEQADLLGEFQSFLRNDRGEVGEDIRDNISIIIEELQNHYEEKFRDILDEYLYNNRNDAESSEDEEEVDYESESFQEFVIDTLISSSYYHRILMYIFNDDHWRYFPASAEAIEDELRERFRDEVTDGLTLQRIADNSRSLEIPDISGYNGLINKFLEETNGFGYDATTDASNYETWSFEPDGSLPSTTGVEIVSPALSLREIYEILPKFFAWAKKAGATAASETGFHMSISFGDNTNLDELDYLKLVLFLGDRHVLDQFNRYGNEFTESALELISRDHKYHRHVRAMARLSEIPEHTFGETLKRAAKEVVSRLYGKYVSIHPKNNYIEFRSAGNEDYIEDVEKLRNTLLRYAYAFTIAMDTEAETREYAKKLYKFLSGFSFSKDVGIDRMKLFALYSANVIDRRQLELFKVKTDRDYHRFELQNDIYKTKDTEKSPTPYLSVYDVVINNKFVRYIQDQSDFTNDDELVHFRYTSGVGESESSVRMDIRKELSEIISRHVQDAKFKSDKGEGTELMIPKVVDPKTKKLVPFNPMNKSHLPDRDIQLTKIRTD